MSRCTYHDYFIITRLTRPLQVEVTLVHFTVREKNQACGAKIRKGRNNAALCNEREH